ncbi:MAG: agmatinase [Firmicutes bacterium]|nr:agmatinase [Bacillota bacterium]
MWNSLHNSALTLKQTDVAVLGLPFDGAASYRKGAAEAPDRIRSISNHIAPTTEDGASLEHLKVLDLGNLLPSGLSQEAYFEVIEKKAAELFDCTFPTFIGGDHSVSIPLLRAAAKKWGSGLGVIHLDAHLDLCFELEGNRLSHGCTHRRIFEGGLLPFEQVWFVGIRSFETQESNFLKDQPANLIKAMEIYEKGLPSAAARVVSSLQNCEAVYLTIDIDFLDPAFAPGTGTPKPGGFSTRELLAFLKHFAVLPIIGFDLVEVAPPLDHADITSFAAQRAITEAWGYFINNNRARNHFK